MGLWNALIGKVEVTNLLGGKAFNEIAVLQGKNSLDLLDDYLIGQVHSNVYGRMPIILTQDFLDTKNRINTKDFRGHTFHDSTGQEIMIGSTHNISGNIIQAFINWNMQ